MNEHRKYYKIRNRTFINYEQLDNGVMRTIQLQRVVKLIGLVMLCTTRVNADDKLPKLLYPATVQKEADLVRSIFQDTNAPFDELICRAANLNSNETATVLFEEISFIFIYKTTNDIANSSCEMGAPDNLNFKNGEIHRSNRVTEAPLNYLRVVDPGCASPKAELDVIMKVLSGDGDKATKIIRRSFQHLENNTWESLDLK